MEQQDLRVLQEQVRSLERRLKFATGALSVILGLLLFAAWTPQAKTKSDVLRARGLVIVDGQGRERILIGAPVPQVAGRKRRDPTNGLLILNENGADRVVVGSPVPDPQSGGRVSQRISPATGISVNDRDGDERGGFGILEKDGRVVLGLDRAESGEGVMLFVLPDSAGVLINGKNGRQRVFLGDNVSEGTAGLYLDDSAEKKRAQLRVEQDGSPLLQMFDKNQSPILTIPEGKR